MCKYMTVVTLISSEAIDLLWPGNEAIGDCVCRNNGWGMAIGPICSTSGSPDSNKKYFFIVYLPDPHTHTHTHTRLRAFAHSLLHILSISRCCVYPVTGFIPRSEIPHRKQLLTRTLQLDPNLETLCLMKVSSLLLYCHLR